MDVNSVAFLVIVLVAIAVWLAIRKRQAEKRQAAADAESAERRRKQAKERQAVLREHPNRDVETRTRTPKLVRDLKPGDLFSQAYSGIGITLVVTPETKASTAEELRFEYGLVTDTGLVREGVVLVNWVYAHGDSAGLRGPGLRLKADTEIIAYVED